MAGYKTLLERGENESVINKSTFLAVAQPVGDEAEAQKLIQAEKKRYPDARHCCWAYVLGADGQQKRYADDGEPQGTAGLPMLDVITKKGLTNVLVMVTRYFGGVLLGTGGLTRAYAGGAAAAIESAGVAEMTLSRRMTLTVPYPAYARLERKLEKMPILRTDVSFGDAVSVTFLVRVGEEEELTASFTEFLAGTPALTVGESLFYPWPADSSDL